MGKIPQEDTTNININALKIIMSKYMKQTLTELKGNTDSNTVIQGTAIPHFKQWVDHSE